MLSVSDWRSFILSISLVISSILGVLPFESDSKADLSVLQFDVREYVRVVDFLAGLGRYGWA